MVLFNYSTKELTAKIVYYGPGLCGKTTNLQFIHSNLPDTVKGKMLSLATKTDRTLFFDFLPIDLGEIRGMKTRVQLYTVPGQVFYNETRKLVLKGADGIVFVADSQQQMLGANVESFKNLEDNLKAHGITLAEMPHVIQFNKRDLPKLASIEEMNAAISKYNAPFYESVATTGIGVQDTLKAITKLVLLNLTRKYDPRGASAAAPAPSPAPAHPIAAAPPPVAAVPPSPPAVAPTPPVPATTRESVPLSVPPTVSADSLSDSLSESPAALAPVPEFNVDEIEELVDEVEETPAEPMPLATPQLVAPSDGSFEIDSTGLALEEPAEAGLEAEAVPVAEREEEPAVESFPEAEIETPPAAPEDFQIDHHVDPDWARPEEAPAGPAEIEAIPMPDVGLPVPDPMDLAPPAEAAVDDEPVTLTDVVEDRELFEDPSLEVATLAGADEREIIVPVELKDGESVRRFRLSIRLRLDPVE
jgi:signal recognition particle receptor subunit beta